jgi:hypothetical protein
MQLLLDLLSDVFISLVDYAEGASPVCGKGISSMVLN